MMILFPQACFLNFLRIFFWNLESWIMGCVHAEKQEVCVWLCVLTCLLFHEPCAVVMWLLSLFLKWTAWLHVSMHTQQWSAAQVRVHTAYVNKHTHTHNIFDFQSNLADWECLNTRDIHPLMISFKLSLRDLISAWLLKTIPIHLCSNSFTHEWNHIAVIWTQ